jgi:hypothetical protein
MARRNVELGFFEKYCIQCERVMYRNVDALLQWMRTFKKHLKDNGLAQSKVYLYIFYSKDKNGEIYLLLILFVDDTLWQGNAKEYTLDLRNHSKGASLPTFWDNSRSILEFGG